MALSVGPRGQTDNVLGRTPAVELQYISCTRFATQLPTPPPPPGSRAPLDLVEPGRLRGLPLATALQNKRSVFTDFARCWPGSHL
ncbi:hypothetical protein BN2537_11391 [Streptomyces venezuelae]|nr:hypothetical protein BN2537_11391 [Streptomyces venezuelae]